MMNGPETARVLCPDGVVAETFDGRDAKVYAFEHAALCDRAHDGARCVGPHLVQVATWTTVELPCCDLADLRTYDPNRRPPGMTNHYCPRCSCNKGGWINEPNPRTEACSEDDCPCHDETLVAS